MKSLQIIRILVVIFCLLVLEAVVIVSVAGGPAVISWLIAWQILILAVGTVLITPLLRSSVAEERAKAIRERLVVLNQPLGDTGDICFEDLFDLNEIQMMQDAFARATGVASLITDHTGRWITKPSCFTHLCGDIIRKTPKGCENCRKSDVILGRVHPGGPVVQCCLSGGLWDGGTSICVEGRHIASWFIGQVVDINSNEEDLVKYADVIGADKEEFRRALREVPRMERAKFDQICQALYVFADQLSRMALQNLQQTRYIRERKIVEEALRDATFKAEAASRAKDQFMAMVSHELRTPLTPVLLSTSHMAGDQKVPSDVRDELERIQHYVEMEARLIDDLLDLSRAMTGKLSLRDGVCDLRQVVDAVENVCGEDIRGKGLHLEVVCHAPNTCVKGDFGRLQQVLWNLVKNAIKFTDRGGRIRVELRPALVSEGSAGDIALVVSDNGRGIEPELIQRIFGIFQQGDDKSRQLGGLGIGLAICKAVVEAHGGHISVFSEGVGKGASFIVILPTTSDPAPVAHNHPSPEELHAATRDIPRRSILLVEDHAVTAKLIARLLTLDGHSVVVAGSVAEAVRVAKENHFDLLLSDIGLPDGTGMEMLTQVRALRGDIPAIALSGFGTDQDMQRSLASGFAEHLVKPIDYDHLKSAVTRVAMGTQAVAQ